MTDHRPPMGLRRRRAARPFAGPTAAALIALTALLGATPVAHATALPDGRAYEWVSTNTADGVSASQGALGSIINDDTMIYGGGATILGPGASGGNPTYLAQRSTSGWSLTTLSPPGLLPNQNATVVQASQSGDAYVFNLGSTVAISPTQATRAPTGLDLYDGNGGWSTIIADANPQTAPDDPSVADASAFAGMSSDGQTIVYSSSATPAGLTPAQHAGVTMRKAYAWTPSGTRRLQGASGDPLANCDTQAVGSVGSPNNSTDAVSTDGSTVFLQNSTANGGPGANCPAGDELYVNRGGRNVQISVPTDGTPQAAPADELGANFVGATPDGTTAYFSSADQLTADAPAAGTATELYQWTDPPGGSATVTCVTCSLPAGLTYFQGAASANGEYVYFTMFEPGGATGDLYVDDRGTVQLVSDADNAYLLGETAVSADGDTIVFPLLDNGGLERAVVSPTGVSSECISCDASGTEYPASVGMAGATFPGYPSPGAAFGFGAQTITADGQTVVYVSNAALAPGAVDGVTQVYRWTAGEGNALIASNQTSGGAEVSPDGTNIAFFSSDPLTPGVTAPPTSNLFDARIGGGFPVAAAPGGCSGEACRTTGSGPPSPSPIATTGPSSGNRHTPPAPSTRLTVARLGAAARRRLASGRPVTLVVRARGRGLVRARLDVHGSPGGHRRATATARLRDAVSRTRTVHLRLALGRRARQALADARRSTVTVTVSLPLARSRHIRFTLTRRTGR